MNDANLNMQNIPMFTAYRSDQHFPDTNNETYIHEQETCL